MASSRPISPRLAKEFFEAVREYIRWNLGDPEPSITVDRYVVPISLLCDRVSGFNDPLPDEVSDAMCFIIDGTQAQLKKELRAERTYATAARCLLELIEDKKRKYPRREDQSRIG